MSKLFNKSATALLFLLPVVNTAHSQEIFGCVTDSKTHEPIIGATVQADGSNSMTVTDIDGNFILSGLRKNSKYNISIKYLSYKTKNIADVLSSQPGTGSRLNVLLSADEQKLGEVTVTALARNNTEAAMISKVRRSPVVVSNVSAQEIKRTQDSNAGEVIRRVPGVSLIDGKFVMVRGLAQRYNNVWINGGAVPGSEADTRAFSFDLIPSSQIDNLSVVKTLSAEYPADYSGGFILIETKEIPRSNDVHITFGGNWNSQSAFKGFCHAQSSPTDWLGFDSGMRSLDGGMNAGLRSLGTNGGGNTMYDLLGNGLSNNWMTKRSHPLGDIKLGADWNRSWKLPDGWLGMASAVIYTNEYRTCLGMINNFYGVYDADNDRETPLRLSVDNQYANNVRLGAMLNMTYLSGSGHTKLQLKNLFNQLGNSRFTSREGLSAQSEQERSAEYYYRSRTIYTGQVTGRHTFSGDALDWSVGYAYANRRLPDRRKYILYKDDDTDADNYVWLYQNDISREWTSLDEHIISAQINGEHRFSSGSWQPALKAGLYGEFRSRSYRTRNFIYWYNSVGNTLPENFRSSDIAYLLSSEANFGADKLYLLEDENKINDYSGRNMLGAGYVSATLPLGRVTVLAGLRCEWNQMELISNTRQYEESHKSHFYRRADLFPSANVTWHVSSSHQLRFACGRSVNRPEFREVSPSVYYDFDLAADVQGNYDLHNCYINNFDLRWEWYPSKGETVSLAAFYKHFDSPIEWVYTMSGGTDVIYSYSNAGAANNLGLELDIRKRLGFIGLPQLSWSFNGSLIHSRISYDENGRQRSRAMQGQSPYIVNTGLFYNDEHLGLSAALLYNRIGKRIVGVGRSEGGSEGKNVRVPDSYEMPRDAVDVTMAKTFGKNIELKLSIRDILNSPVRFCQFADVDYADGSSRKVTQTTRRYRTGRNLQLMLTWKL